MSRTATTTTTTNRITSDYVWGPPKSSKHVTHNHPCFAKLPGLYEILTLKRPDNSGAEWALIDEYIAPTGALPDDYGNYWLTIPKADGSPSLVLWSSHTDTVHKVSGRQALVLHNGVDLYAADSNCLGADCGTGVWLMLQMIEAKVPGTYIFHRTEETGGKGSDYIADKLEDQLAGLKYAIAFDRKGYMSTITYQFGSRCCSEAFAESLGTAIGLGFEADDTGTFTDTANYMAIIPECTNISVGYFAQHTSAEHQNLPFLITLRDKMLAFDEDLLVCERDPDTRDYAKSMWGNVTATEADSIDRLVYHNSKAIAIILLELGCDAAWLQAEVRKVENRDDFTDDAFEF